MAKGIIQHNLRVPVDTYRDRENMQRGRFLIRSSFILEEKMICMILMLCKDK